MHLAIDRLGTGLAAEKVDLARGHHLLCEAWKTYFLLFECARQESEAIRPCVASALADARGSLEHVIGRNLPSSRLVH